MQDQLASFRNLRMINQNEVDNLERKVNFYPDGHQFSDGLHPYTDDLDIFGDFSLFHYINRCFTRNGNAKLAAVLKEPPAKEEVKARQEAVQELKGHLEKGQWFRATLLPLKSGELNDIAYSLKHYFKKSLEFTNSKWLKSYSRVAPYLLLLVLAAVLLGAVTWKILLVLFLVNYVISAQYNKQVNYLHEITGANSSKIKVYARVLEWLETQKWESTYLKDLVVACRQSSSDEEAAFRQTARFGKLVQQLDYRLNIVVSVVLNLGFLWDIRCAYKIKEWYEHSSETVIRSFDLIGQFEALISLSTLSYNNPDWIFPTLEDGFKLAATKMGHPLIDAKSRIYNDYSFVDAKTVDVITGSNMSGKSTFLRTIGVNVVLAFTGAPVCCNSLTLSPIRLISYMRIKDSLSESTSTFKAEINRLKMILNITEHTGNSFALVDEMLRGTNSRDKFLGTRAFIEKLIGQNSAAIIATHDLQVAELAEKYPTKVRNYHFDIQTDGTEMFFDYKLKEGECKTFNASILLKQIGLEIDEMEN